MDAGDLSQELAAMLGRGAALDALTLISSVADPLEAASAISAALNMLYNSNRDIKNMIVAAYLGITWCAGQASLQNDGRIAAALKKRAHAMSFNAAANCWPGWGDEGTTIKDDEVEAARVLAGLCLALALDLGLGAKGLGTAYWLIGALELAAGRIEAARTAFQEAERSYEALADEAPQLLMAKGYDRLAAKFGEPGSDEAARALEVALEQLRAVGSKDGAFFADQIEKAEQELAARRSV